MAESASEAAARRQVMGKVLLGVCHVVVVALGITRRPQGRALRGSTPGIMMNSAHRTGTASPEQPSAEQSSFQSRLSSSV